MVKLRVLGAIVYHTYLQPTPIPPHALFQPAVTSSRAPLLETDYNLHKSNSTYFSDMDASRSHLFTAVIRNAIRKDSAAKKEGSRHIVALGGISCLFKKEIKPYAKYEMWSRVLCWDRKWFYLITHLVKPGVGKPASWTLQPWRKTKSGADQDVDKDKLMGAVYATAIAKYVIKKGRLTISPEQALRDADMVPAKPDGWVYHGEVNGNANGDILPDTVKADEWTWDVIEKERLRGLAVAQKFADMEGLHESFDGGREGALGEFSDLIF